jgi:hypothetical protein
MERNALLYKELKMTDDPVRMSSGAFKALCQYSEQISKLILKEARRHAQERNCPRVEDRDVFEAGQAALYFMLLGQNSRHDQPAVRGSCYPIIK